MRIFLDFRNDIIKLGGFEREIKHKKEKNLSTEDLWVSCRSVQTCGLKVWGCWAPSGSVNEPDS